MSPRSQWCRLVTLLGVASLSASCRDYELPSASGGADAGAAADANAGCQPLKRFVIEDPGDDNRGSGLVKDTKTGLTWTRSSYSDGWKLPSEAAAFCVARGMRLPTKDEALEISGPNFDICTFTKRWATWTSTPSGTDRAWYVFDTGETFDGDVGTHAAMCVK